MALANNFIALFLESAPWLLLGLMLAGLLKEFVSMTWMHKQLGGHGISATIKAAALGAPLPLCSCGVIPAAIGLRRAGASKSATTSFLVSTPETGIDSVSVSYVLLGPFMAMVRPIAAVSSAIVAGLLVGKEENKEINQAISFEPVKSCCKNKVVSGESQSVARKKGKFFTRLYNGLYYSATVLIADTTFWLLIGLFFAALVQTYIPTSFFAEYGDSIFAMLIVMAISVPMYICATASTPIAAGLLLAGVSPGAVLVFMLTGPATNIATLGVVAKELGKRALVSYLVGVVGVALVSGYLVNYLVDTYGIIVTPQIGPEHQLLPEWMIIASGVILAVFMTRVLIKKTSKKLKLASNH